MFITARDELEEQVCGVLVKWDVANFIADQNAVATQRRQLRGELAAGMCFLQPGDPAGGGVEEDAVAVLGGLDAQCDGEVGLAGAGRAEEHDVLGLADERARAQVRDQVPVGCGLVVEVEVLEGLVAGEPGRFDPQRGAGRLPFGHLAGIA